MGALAHVREGPDGDVGLDDRALQDAGPDDGALADAGVEDLAAAADDGVALDDGPAAQDHDGLDGDVLGDLHAGVDEGAGGVPQRHAGAHVGLVDAQAHLQLGVGQLGPVIDAQQRAVILDLQGGDRAVIGEGHGHQLRQVQLPGHRRRLHIADAAAQPGDLEGVQPGVDLVDGQLIGASRPWPPRRG